RAKELAVRRPLAIAVTVLTSLDRAALSRELAVASSVEGHVLHLCALAKEAGLDGSVASPLEVAAIRRSLGGQWVVVTPGVRPAGSAAGDQSRIATPAATARAGAHFLVVGRPIPPGPRWTSWRSWPRERASRGADPPALPDRRHPLRPVHPQVRHHVAVLHRPARGDLVPGRPRPNRGAHRRRGHGLRRGSHRRHPVRGASPGGRRQPGPEDPAHLPPPRAHGPR